MQKFKLMIGILGLLLSFVTMGEDNYAYKQDGKIDLSGGTYTARIIAAKAVVYADENMLSPIGYIANGKAIKVGNPRRINPNLVPMIVYGRLAFIEISDIQYENASDEEYKFKKGAPLEHNFDLILERPPENLFQNNSGYLGFQAYTGGGDLSDIFTYLDGKSKSLIMGLDAQFIHRVSTSKNFWGLGMSYNTISSSSFALNYIMIGPVIGFTPIKNPVFALDIYGSLDLSAMNKYDLKIADKSDSSGFIWGFQANARLVFNPDFKYHAYITAGVKRYSVSGHEKFNYTDSALGEEVPSGLKTIYGFNGVLGVAMEFR